MGIGTELSAVAVAKWVTSEKSWRMRSVAAERTLHGQLLFLGLWMKAVGEKRRCEVAESVGG